MAMRPSRRRAEGAGPWERDDAKGHVHAAK